MAADVGQVPHPCTTLLAAAVSAAKAIRSSIESSKEELVAQLRVEMPLLGNSEHFDAHATPSPSTDAEVPDEDDRLQEIEVLRARVALLEERLFKSAAASTSSVATPIVAASGASASSNGLATREEASLLSQTLALVQRAESLTEMERAVMLSTPCFAPASASASVGDASAVSVSLRAASDLATAVAAKLSSELDRQGASSEPLEPRLAALEIALQEQCQRFGFLTASITSTRADLEALRRSRMALLASVGRTQPAAPTASSSVGSSNALT